MFLQYMEVFIEEFLCFEVSPWYHCGITFSGIVIPVLVNFTTENTDGAWQHRRFLNNPAFP
jgi:hypothetical protein